MSTPVGKLAHAVYGSLCNAVHLGDLFCVCVMLQNVDQLLAKRVSCHHCF